MNVDVDDAFEQFFRICHYNLQFPGYRIKVKIPVSSSAAENPIGTAWNNNCGNSSVRPSSVEQAPSIKLPPDENGEIAEDWAPTMIAINKNIGSRPSEVESAGTSGNKAGATTPKVLENKDMIAATMQIANGTR